MNFRKIEAQLYPETVISNFSSMRQATCSGVFSDVACKARERCTMYEVLRSFAEKCHMCIIHVGSARSETGECSAKNDHVSALLYFTY